MWDITDTAEASYLLSDLAVSVRSGWYLWYGLRSVWWTQAGLVFQAVWTRASLIRLLWAFGLASYKAIVAAGQDILCTPIADRGNRSKEERKTDRQTDKVTEDTILWQGKQMQLFSRLKHFLCPWRLLADGDSICDWMKVNSEGLCPLLCIISKFILKVKVILLYCRLL